MQINHNKTNFNGRMEVMYNLENASKNLKLVGKTHKAMLERNEYLATAKAYIDSAVYDDCFVRTVKDIVSSREKAFWSTNLKQESQINPFELFYKYTKEAIKKHNRNIKAETLKEFFEILSK